MKVGIWGAGNLGTGLAYRLATTPFISEIYWSNQTYAKIERPIIDLEQGLAFAPTCHAVHGFRQEDAAEMIPNLDVLVLTLGKRVPPGGTREQMYRENSEVYRKTIVPALRGNFKGIEAIAHDQKTILTVSVLDPETPEKLFYSMPCCLGGSGVEMRFNDQRPEILKALDACQENLRKSLRCAAEA